MMMPIREPRAGHYDGSKGLNMGSLCHTLLCIKLLLRAHSLHILFRSVQYAHMHTYILIQLLHCCIFAVVICKQIDLLLHKSYLCRGTLYRNHSRLPNLERNEESAAAASFSNLNPWTKIEDTVVSVEVAMHRSGTKYTLAV